MEQEILDILGGPHDNCYVASEVYYHLNGGKQAGLKPVNGKVNGISHWWLVNEFGKVIDITKDQFESPIDYSLGRGKGFLTKGPSKRAQKVMREINAQEN